MRVGVYPGDMGGCGHYRMIWPAEALQRQGHDVTIIPPHTEGAVFQCLVSDGYVPYRPNKAHPPKMIPTHNVVGLAEPPPFDVVVLQRPGSKMLAQAIPHLQAAGVAVVVELDDDFLRIDPRNSAWWGYQAHLDPNNNSDWIVQAIESADLVTVTTPTLRDVFARHASTEPVIIPNYLPAHAYASHVHPPTAWPTVGWSGSVATHPADLRVASVAPVTRLPEYGGFHVVGTGEGVREQLGLAGPFTTSEGWLPIEEYHAALDAIDIGIVPLTAGRFNEAKSWLKGLEFAARGIPAVCTPTGPYEALAVRGGCLLASDVKAWRRNLTHLIKDAGYREDVGKAAYACAIDLLVDDHAEEFADAWSLARARRLVAA